jgi:hypothetical protein
LSFLFHRGTEKTKQILNILLILSEVLSERETGDIGAEIVEILYPPSLKASAYVKTTADKLARQARLTAGQSKKPRSLFEKRGLGIQFIAPSL